MAKVLVAHVQVFVETVIAHGMVTSLSLLTRVTYPLYPLSRYRYTLLSVALTTDEVSICGWLLFPFFFHPSIMSLHVFIFFNHMATQAQTHTTHTPSHPYTPTHTYTTHTHTQFPSIHLLIQPGCVSSLSTDINPAQLLCERSVHKILQSAQ